MTRRRWTVEPRTARRRLLERRSANGPDRHIVLISFRAAAVSAAGEELAPRYGRPRPLSLLAQPGPRRAGRESPGGKEGGGPRGLPVRFPRSRAPAIDARSLPPVLTAPMPGLPAPGFGAGRAAVPG